MTETTNKKKGEKALVEFSKSSQQSELKTHISKIMSNLSIKHGCQIAFIAKQPYLDQNLYQLIYLNAKHKNKQSQVYHGKDVIGYYHALSSQLLDGMKAHLMRLLRQGLSPTQVMTYH